MIMVSANNQKQYDLEERTFEFARRCRGFIKKLPKTISNIEDEKQLARASGSVAANYIEANEALSKKDFIMRIKISRKESKESRMWFKLCDTGNNKELDREQQDLIQEATELMNIFGSIIHKSE
jgi:four helix bundle protein